MAGIKLNFLPLKKSKFEFSIYRRLKKDDDTKTDNLFFYHLTDASNGKGREHYAVSFQDFEGAVQGSISSLESKDLTKRFLLQSLLEGLSARETKYPFEVRHRFAVHQVDFTIEEVPEGKKIVYLSPYFLEDQSKFGFIIDYKFAKAADVGFDKSIQRYSLSLDAQFRSNRNFYADKFHLLTNFIEKSYSDWQSIPSRSGEAIEVSNLLNESPAFSLSKKEYIFNNNNVAYSQFQGIKNYGPYRKLDQEVIFVFLFEERFKSFANELYLSLSGKSNPGTFSGFESIFKLKINVQNVRQVRLENYEPENLTLALDKVKSFQEPGKQLIGIFIEDYDMDKGGEVSMTYYFLKYQFIKENIPLQVVNYRKLGDRNALKWLGIPRRVTMSFRGKRSMYLAGGRVQQMLF